MLLSLNNRLITIMKIIIITVGILQVLRHRRLVAFPFYFARNFYTLWCSMGSFISFEVRSADSYPVNAEVLKQSRCG